MKSITLYKVQFRTRGSGTLSMDTVDSTKIGPWIAEMFSVFPYESGLSAANEPVSITTGELWYE